MVKIYKKNGDFVSNASFISPWKGLMFSKKLKSGESVILNNKNLYELFIHMLFVFQKLDIAFLDENFRVFQVKKNLKPFISFAIPKEKPCYVLEGNSLDLKVGDKLEKDI